MTISKHKALSAAVAVSVALALTALPASASTPPTTLASALAALTAAEAQVTTAIHDKPATPGAAWDAQMDAALAAEATAEAQLRPFLSPPSPCLQCGLTHSFDYRYGSGLTYQVQLAPINGSTTAGPGPGGLGAGAGCDKNGLAFNQIANYSGVCYESFQLAGTTYPNEKFVSGVMVNLNVMGNGNLTGVRTQTIYVNFVTQVTVLGSNGQTYHPIQYRYVGGNQQLVGRSWSHAGGSYVDLPAGVKVVQVKWSNVDPNGETTTAVWNV